MLFETSGVTVAWWVPPLVAFAISSVTSTGGVSGAFLILPFQVSVLGFVSPAVTPTNHLYNVVAIPGGVYRFFREKRLLWPVSTVVVLGTLPGVAVGFWARVKYLPDPRAFKLFVGAVLLLVGGRLLWENILRPLLERTGAVRAPAPAPAETVTPVVVEAFTWKKIAYRFSGRTYEVSTFRLFALAAVVGLIGGAYGIGGGAIIAPFLVALFGLPVYTIAGAALLGTFITSSFAVLLFSLLAPWYGAAGLAVSPDWTLGVLFGIGGFAGTYVGARLQRFLPARAIKGVLGTAITFLALRYVVGYFLA